MENNHFYGENAENNRIDAEMKLQRIFAVLTVEVADTPNNSGVLMFSGTQQMGAYVKNKTRFGYSVSRLQNCKYDRTAKQYSKNYIGLLGLYARFVLFCDERGEIELPDELVDEYVRFLASLLKETLLTEEGRESLGIEGRTQTADKTA